jgi:integrase
MASSWIERRSTGAGTRYRVRFRVGGSEDVPRLAGTFGTAREAQARRAWVLGELAAMRMPDVHALRTSAPSPTLAEVAAKWRDSRVDVADGTAATHRVNLGRILPKLGTRRLDTLEAADAAGLVTALHEDGLKRESIRKTIATLAMVLDYAKVSPNPARDKTTVKLPREDKVELNPPTAEHVLSVHHLLAPAYRLPLLVLDATGMRVGELEALTWGDVDEPRGRWRVSAASSKTGRARWVSVPPVLFEAVTGLMAREDRDLDGQVFSGFSADRLRTAISRACKAAGIPSFSPHDLRHRRISLLHLGGVPWARIGEHVGQRNLAVTANTYTHVLADEEELDYCVLLASYAATQCSSRSVRLRTSSS